MEKILHTGQPQQIITTEEQIRTKIGMHIKLEIK